MLILIFLLCKQFLVSVNLPVLGSTIYSCLFVFEIMPKKTLLACGASKKSIHQPQATRPNILCTLILSQATDYRGINVTSVIVRAFEKILLMVNASYNGRAPNHNSVCIYMQDWGWGVAVRKHFSVFSQSSIRFIGILIPESARQYVYLQWTLVRHLTV